MVREFLDRLEKSTNYPFIKKFKESTNPPIPKNKYRRVMDIIEKALSGRDYKFLGGVSVFTFSGVQFVVVSRNRPIAQDFIITEEIVNDLDSEVFFQALPDKIERDGLGYMEFEYFEKYFAKVVDGFAIAFQVIEDEKKLEKRLNRIINDIKEILKDVPLVPETPGEETAEDSSEQNFEPMPETRTE